MSEIQISGPAFPTPGRVGQGTAVEMSRAAQEVQAQVFVARQFPRSEVTSVEKLKASCQNRAFADRAFFSYLRGNLVAGPSIHLAKELARCWGNVTYGLVELRRDDEYRQSEMQAWAWCLEANERVSTTFIVPHAMDTKGGRKNLDDLRSIYENNANAGARRLREMIFSVMPVWYVEMGKELCSATLKHGGGVPLPQRIAEGIAAFGRLGVTVDQLERQRDRKSSEWTDLDVAQLQILFGSIDRGEISRADAFPVERVTIEELREQSTPREQQEAPATQDGPRPWPTVARVPNGVEE